MPVMKIMLNGNWVTVGNPSSDIVVIDSTITSFSNNPVASKAIYAALADKSDAGHTHDYESSGTASSLLNRTTAVNVADVNYSTYMARGIALSNSGQSPTTNGTMVFNYG